MQPAKYGIIGTKTLATCLLLFLTSGTLSARGTYKITEQTGFNFINLTQIDTIRTDDSLYYDDSNDEEMYTPYDKWRIDTFDNWGKHKKKLSPVTTPDTSAADTLNIHKRKGLTDKDKETMIFCPEKRVSVENVNNGAACSFFRRYNELFLISYYKHISD
jgi:hypothetical protein